MDPIDETVFVVSKGNLSGLQLTNGFEIAFIPAYIVPSDLQKPVSSKITGKCE